MDDDIPYLLLTPGPLTTSKSVKQVMLNDFCTWDDDYNSIVSEIRQKLVRLATSSDEYTAVLVQGSGTFAVEATIGSVVPHDGKLLAVNNGAYGKRIVQIAQRLEIPGTELFHPETEPADPARIDAVLAADSQITHVAVVHCETTTGMLNPVAEIGAVVKKHNRLFIVDAMSSFGGIPLSIDELSADFLVSSANKCLQGVPGFGFVIARRAVLEASAGRARSLSLDLHEQWTEMEFKGGKWRYTSPTHVVRAFAQALVELEQEGGVAARYRRYSENHRLLVEGMEQLGFRPLLAAEHRSPIITSFLFPDDEQFTFESFYHAVKRRRFVLYPGKVSQAETFRIGTIGHVFPDDIRQLCRAIGEAIEELRVRVR
jgi:2-aminoethylphosphonate-pyruvate transaminase